MHVAIGRWLAGAYLKALNKRIDAAEKISREAVATNRDIIKRLRTLEPLMEDAAANAQGANVEATKARQAWATDRQDREDCLARCEGAQRRTEAAALEVSLAVRKSKPVVAGVDVANDGDVSSSFMVINEPGKPLRIIDMPPPGQPGKDADAEPKAE